jgi:hypothetical protein
LRARNSQQPFGVLICNQDHDFRISKVASMLRQAALRLTAEGRLLGFDTGDWSILLGGFVLAGLVALLV